MQEKIQLLKDVQLELAKVTKANSQRVATHRNILTDVGKICNKFSSKLALLANSIHKEVLSNDSQQPISYVYRLLSQALQRLADCSRKVSVRGKLQVCEPVKEFISNYEASHDELRYRLENRLSSLSKNNEQMVKFRVAYHLTCEKLEKHKSTQEKTLSRIETGNIKELEKYNSNLKKLTEAIADSEKGYINAIEQCKAEWQAVKAELEHLNESNSQNEVFRLNKFHAAATASLKTLESFQINIEGQPPTELLPRQAKGKPALESKIVSLLESPFRDEFVPYEVILRQKRKKETELDNEQLLEKFKTLKEREKGIIQELVEDQISDSRVVGALKANTETDQVREKILSVEAYSFYYIELIHSRITDMNNFFCRLSEESFYFILNVFTIIVRNLTFQQHSALLHAEMLFKIMQCSERVTLKKTERKSKPLELMSQALGRNIGKSIDANMLRQLLNFVEFKRVGRKKETIITSIFAAMKGKKSVLAPEEQFYCLQQLTTLAANFSIPNSVVLPFIKKSLGAYSNSYDYLKGVILAKKDAEERLRQSFHTQIKAKKEERWRRAVETATMAHYCLALTAKSGLLNRADVNLRLVCRSLQSTHLLILCELSLPTTQKWTHLIPLARKDYILMKQEVAEQSVPSPVQQIISLDVHRSLTLHGQYLSPTTLHSLLRTYAFYHKQISYCQGMNYIAGYLYLKTREETSSYFMFEWLMENRFKEIFLDQFEILKRKMYQFERLLAIFHPDISEHFKKEAITPECYIVPWIITVFTSSYQYTLHSYLIDLLWERFIVFGWRELFGFLLWVFHLHKTQLLELSYDRALHMLGELGKSPIFLASPEQFRKEFAHVGDPKQGMKTYAVSEEFLRQYEQEYTLDN